MPEEHGRTRLTRAAARPRTSPARCHVGSSDRAVGGQAQPLERAVDADGRDPQPHRDGNRV